jgi:hypothetical protein
MGNTTRNFRISKLEVKHVNALNVLTSVGQSLATIAAALGTGLEDSEKKLSALIDEGLCNRTRGSRPVALYTVV